ncbi:MAG: helix-turn-helix domain-containing protein [Streptosporangiales bacterium]|nr:helix-turn-helix domain-containing protein [Streptosporangiales bacterium]
MRLVNVWPMRCRGKYRPVMDTRVFTLRLMMRTGEARRRREAVGASYPEAGESASPPVHPSTIHRWETGERLPHGAAAVAYLDVLEAFARLIEREGAA